MLMSLYAKGQPHAGHACRAWGRPESGCPQGDGPDTGICAPHGQERLKRDSRMQDQAEEFKRIVPGPGGSTSPLSALSEKTIRRMIYSGKKKRFTYNTNVYTNADGVVIAISRSSVGSPATGHAAQGGPDAVWQVAESMRDSSTPEEAGCRIWADRGLREPARICPARRHDPPQEVQERLPSRRSTTTWELHPSARRALHRKAQAWQTRTTGRLSQFNHEFNVITGLVNLACSGIRSDKGPPSSWQVGDVLTGAGPSLLQAAPF